MPNYRRDKTPGATFFFTVAAAQRGGKILTDNIHLLRCAYLRTWQEQPFRCDAMVVLPDHIHAVWTLPEGDCDYSTRWRKLKSRFTRSLGQTMGRSLSKVMKNERGIWQRRFWEHRIRDADDYCHHLEYCRVNPVKHGLVEAAEDWPFSSFNRNP